MRPVDLLLLLVVAGCAPAPRQESHWVTETRARCEAWERNYASTDDPVKRARYASAADNCWSAVGDMEARAAALRARYALILESPPAPKPEVFPYTPSQTYVPPPAPYVPTVRQPPLEPSPVQTWRDTPCAPAIPPVMLDQPTTVVNELIPPACR